MKKKENTQITKKNLTKTILWSLVVVIMLLALLVAAIQIPYVQTRIIQKFTQVISEKTGFQSNIKRVNIKWFDTMVLDSITILDQQHQEMIWVENLAVDFDLLSFIEGREINLDEARVNNARVHLLKDTVKNELNMTAFIEAIRDLTRKKDKNLNNPPPIFRINNIQLRNVTFNYFDVSKERITGQFDYHHFQLENIDADVENLRSVSDTFEINVSRLAGYEPSYDFTIHDFTGFYRLTDQSMAFQDFKLYAGNSTLQDSVVFNYENKSSLSYFNDSVTIAANIDKTQIHSKDLALFAPYLNQYNEFYTISGRFNGEVKSFSVKDFVLNFGAQSHLMGDVNFDGLPDFKETFIDLDLKNSVVDVRDLKQYIQNDSAYKNVEVFGIVNFDAEFLGFPNDFVANGQFDTHLGQIDSDINLKLDSKVPEYSGKLALTDFDLGAVSQQPELLQKTTFSGEIDGQGLTLEEADFNLKAKFDYLGVNHYTFSNIQTDARVGTSFFEGKLSIHDPNLKFNATGTVDLREGKQDVVLDAKLDTAFLQAINLTKENVFISTEFKTNTHELEIDSITGTAQFKNLYAIYQDRQLIIDSLWLRSEKAENERKFSLQTEQLKAMLTGNYKFSTLIEDIQTLVKEYRMIFSNDENELEAYFAKKEFKSPEEYKKEEYELNYQIALEDINPLLHLFVPNISISSNTYIEGRITGGYTHILSLNTQIDTIQYNGNYFYNNEIDISTSKITDGTDVLAMVYLESNEQDLIQNGIVTQTENFTTEAIWADDHIDFQQSIWQQNTNNHINISGYLTFLPDSTLIKLNSANVQLLDREWSVNEENSVLFANDEIYFDSLSFFNILPSGEYQEVSAYGTLSGDPNKQLTINISNFLVDNLNPLLIRDYQGIVNGFIDIKSFGKDKEDSLNNLILNSEISVQNFTINDFLAGDIIGLAKWDDGESQLNLSMMVNRLEERIISLNGTYDPKEKQNQLDLTASFQDAQINIIEPYIEDFFSELGGTADGNVTLTGRWDHPILKGSGKVNNGKAKINYLNTNYIFNGNLIFEENSVGVSDLVMHDNRGQAASFNGGIFHDGFKDFVLDLNGTLDNVSVLNTSLKDNDLFYGKGYATGKVSLLGAINNLNISARLTTQKGTKIYIPIGGAEGVEQSEFISFVSFNDSTISAENNVDKINLTGLNLDLEIEVTPDAYGEIIFDAKTGDIIRGRGNGQLQLGISSEGDFTMFGDVTFIEGAYNFTLYNIINKEFQIEPGSSIAWLGDPYGGTLDIKATYEQLASLAPLILDETAKETDEVKRKYKAEVLLKLTGDLMSPDIDFDINVGNYPESNLYLQTAVASLKSNTALDNEELKRQVFSLIVLRRFSERGSFDGSNAVSSSVSEFLSNQFSYWFSQVDENLEIDVDLGSFDDDQFNTFQLRLSYTLFDGRLRITRDGGFTNVNNETNTASVIGDVTVEYLLTKDGKYRVKMFNRNNFNSAAQRLNVANNTTQGISLMHVESFDKVKELFTDARNRAIRSRNENEQVQVGKDPSPAPKTTSGPPLKAIKEP